MAHSSGTTNLRNHLLAWNKNEYDEMFGEKRPQVQPMFTEFVRPSKINVLSPTSEHAKTLTSSIIDFIRRDIRPISVVDGTGFLNLMNVAEPRYVVPCRATITKGEVAMIVTSMPNISLTTDMWTSRAGDGYISLTCHGISSEFELYHRNLLTRHLPYIHYHSSISEALRSGTNEWGIKLEDVSAFTTDNGSNIVKSVDLQKLRIPCAGHTLNLAVQAALNVRRLSTV